MASKFRLRKTIKQLNNVIKQLEENQLSYLKAKTAAQGKIYGYWAHTSGDIGCNSETNVVYDTTVTISDNSHFTLDANGTLWINVGGTYEVNFTVNTDCSSGTGRSGSYAFMQRYNGTTWTTIPGSTCFMYNRGSPYGEATATSTMIYTFNTGDALRVRASRYHGTDTIVINAGGSNLTMTTL